MKEIQLNFDEFKDLSSFSLKQEKGKHIQICFNERPKKHEQEELNYWDKLMKVLSLDELNFVNPSTQKKDNFSICVEVKDGIFYIYYIYYYNQVIKKKFPILLNKWNNLRALRQEIKEYTNEIVDFITNRIKLFNELKKYRNNIENILQKKFKLTNWLTLLKRSFLEKKLEDTFFYDLGQFDIGDILLIKDDKKDYWENEYKFKLTIDLKVREKPYEGNGFEMKFVGLFYLDDQNSIKFQEFEISRDSVNYWNSNKSIERAEEIIKFESDTIKKVKKINNQFKSINFEFNLN